MSNVRVIERGGKSEIEVADELGYKQNRRPLLRETPSPGTEITLQPQISAFWEGLSASAFSPSLIQFVWVAERCIQLVAQNISVMPLKFSSDFPNSVEPAWLSNPDPAWYDNGTADAIFSAVDSFYRWGDAFLYVTTEYASGFPSAWTVLDGASMGVEIDEGTGRRKYEYGGTPLDPSRVVQISRNPRGKLKGTSALRSYADVVNAAAITTRAGSEAVGNTPLSVLKSTRKIDSAQATAIQDMWAAAAAARRPGAPAIMPPELELAGSKLGFSPEELMLVDVQEFNARVLASSCGVPPFLLNLALTGGLTYQNPQMLGEYWWRTELYATCSRIARALTAKMLPRGNSVWFDPTHLTQPLDQQGSEDESPAVNASPAQNNVIPFDPHSTEVMS